MGNLGILGARSQFSQKGEAVHIMAPAGNALTSTNGNGSYKRFGGTSGATALVTGSLAGFEWAAGYHPTAEEAKILLEKTAIATHHSNDDPRENGVGMVNAYKLMMVGKHLKKTCGRDITCFKNMLREDNTYLFHTKDPSLNADVTRAFPTCTSTCTTKDLQKKPASCADKAKVFKKLRKEAFLNPQDKELWEQISCIYGQAGFEGNMLFASSLYESSQPQLPTSSACQQDSDCVLVSNEEGCISPQSPKFTTNTLLAMTRYKAHRHLFKCIARNGKIPLCNGKCRCGPQERFTADPNPQGGKTIEGTFDYSVSCVRFRCVLNKTLVEPPKELEAPPEEPESEDPPVAVPPSGSGSVK